MCIEQELIAAVKAGDARKVASVLNVKGAVSPDTCTSNGFPVLGVAAKKGYKEVLETLLRAGANINLTVTGGILDGATPLYIAALNSHKEVVEVLLRAGANVNLAQKDGATPLYIAAAVGHTEIVKALLRAGAHIDLAMNDGETPIFGAAFNGHKEVVAILLRADANIDLAVTGGIFNGATPLYIAAAVGYKEVVAILLRSSVNLEKVYLEKILKVVQDTGHQGIFKLLEQEHTKFTQLRETLSGIIETSKQKLLQLDLSVLPPEEQEELQRFTAYLNSLQLYTLDEAALTVSRQLLLPVVLPHVKI